VNTISGELKAENREEVVIENASMRLVLGRNGLALSLVHKPTGQECLFPGTKTPAFSITQYRPYDNELQLKDPCREHILLVDEKGQFELQAYDQIEGAAQGNTDIRAFIFNRSGKTYVVYSHNSGEGKLALKPCNGKVHLFKELGCEIPVREENDLIIIPAGDRYYLEMDVDKGGAIATFRDAQVL